MSEKTILLVDDDPKIVRTVQHYLQQEGYAVLVAYYGQEAPVGQHLDKTLQRYILDGIARK